LRMEEHARKSINQRPNQKGKIDIPSEGENTGGKWVKGKREGGNGGRAIGEGMGRGTASSDPAGV